MHYDPLFSANCQGQAFADSYWANSCHFIPTQSATAQLKNHDVVVIGAGFSGLLCAYYLKKEFNIDVCVIEANQVGFGASARNAGFVLKGSGRLSYQQIASKWGLDVSKGIYQEYTAAVERVAGLINEHQIDCEPQAPGYLKIAHNQQAFSALAQQAEFIQNVLGVNCEFLTQPQLQQDYMNNQQGVGALRLADGFGVNPLKLLLGYKQALSELGVPIYEHTHVLNTHMENGRHQITTTQGSINCQTLLHCSNAYANKDASSVIRSRYLPILSSVLVSAPLTHEQLASSGIKTTQLAMDTRILKYYYRLLPDNRLLFGGRGAVFARHQQHPYYKNNLIKGLLECFPSLANLKFDYYWSGYIAASFDDMPHVNYQNNTGYILGYCGAGVSYSAQAAYRLAQMVAGKSVPELPLYTQAAPYIPLRSAHRLGQIGYYLYAQLRDKFG